MTPGIYFDLPRSQYDELVDRVNPTTLKLMGESPAHYKDALDRKVAAQETGEDEETDSDTLLQGQAAHTAALEPDEYGGESTEPQVLDPGGLEPVEVKRGRYLVWHGDRRDPRQKVYQAATARAKAEHKAIITPAMDRFAKLVAKSVRTHPIAAPLLVGGRMEVTVLWPHVEAAVLDLPGWVVEMRTRIDYLTEVAALDLKTTRSAKPEKFARQAWDLGYFHQAAIHLDALEAVEPGKARPYYWIAVETKAPYVVQVYQPSRIGLQLARSQYRDWLATLHACRETGEWPTYCGGTMELDPPRYAVPSEMLEAA